MLRGFIILLFVLLFNTAYSQDVDTILFTTLEDKLKIKVDSISIDSPFYYCVEVYQGCNDKILQTLLVFFKKHKQLNFLVECHTDCRGNQELNKDLSHYHAKKN